jgi:hypothetical protein
MRRSLDALARRREARRKEQRERRAEHGPSFDHPDLAAATRAARRALVSVPSPWLLRRRWDLQARGERWPRRWRLTERLVVRLRPALLEGGLGALRALRRQVARDARRADRRARCSTSGARIPGSWPPGSRRAIRNSEAGRPIRAARLGAKGTKHRPAPVLLTRIGGLDAGSGHAARRRASIGSCAPPRRS